MPFLSHFDPGSTDPGYHVDRDADVEWLRESIASFLRAPDKSRGRAVAILGDRGAGKSTLARKAIEQLREAYLATTLFIVVDCRKVRSQRKLYHVIASQVVDELGYRAGVDAAMLDTARLLAEIASMDEVDQVSLHERITKFESAVTLRGERSLLKHLGISYGLSVERSVKQLGSLKGTIRFDDLRLRGAVVALFEDLRAHLGYDAVVVLDNLDELDHEAIVEAKHRESLLAEIDSLLGLVDAPIGLVLTVRTYFAASLTRSIRNRVLRRMTQGNHVEIVSSRLARELPEIQAAFDDDDCRDCIAKLAALAPTPLALIKWVAYLAEQELHASPDVRQSLSGLARDQLATINLAMLQRVVACFEDLDDSVSAEVLQQAVDNSAVFKQLLRYQIVLPVDFWDPTEFTLSPDLHFMTGPRPSAA